MKRSFQRINSEKSYIPDETLVSFIHNWLHIHKKREQMVKEGRELSSEEKAELRKSDRMKVYILDNMIFPALANLTYFFEALAASDRMANAFVDEIEEILDPRKTKQIANLGGAGGIRMSSMQFRKNNFARLTNAALNIPMKNYPNREFVDDFRISIMYQILNIVGDKMDRVLMHEYSQNQIWKSFYDDYTRMQGWLGLLTRSVKESPKEYDRHLGFQSILASNRAPNGGWDF